MNPAEIAERYLDVLARRAVTAPRDFAGLENTLSWGLGGAAVLFLLTAVIRRSAGAAVSFSLLTLTALIAGIATGRLGFLPPGTASLILCLYACAALLFLTACVRVARDNPVVGAGLLITILGLVALGGASALGLAEAGGMIGWALVGVAVFAVLCVLFDLARGDRAALTLLPGVTLASLSPAPMMAVGPGAPWGQVAAPLVMLAGGTLLATLAAAFVAAPAAVPKPKKTRAGHAPSWADEHAFFGEVGEGAVPAASLDAAPAPEPYARPEPYPQPVPAARPAGTALFAPAVIGGAAEAGGRGSYEPEPLSPASPPATDPASSRWGGTDTVVPQARTAPDEYVWDAMASPEVRAGADALDAFGAASPEALPPEAIREALAPAALDAFDDGVLGGPDPRSGPFRVELPLADGRAVAMEGTRSVDADGILSRLAAQVTPVAARPVAMMRALDLDGDAAAALDRGEIGAHFQPIVRLSDRRTVGFEALARWTKPSGDTVDAQDFVPALIAAGRGLDLAERVADEAARELATWLGAQSGQGQFVSVNIAATDLDKKGLAALIGRVVEAHGLPPGALVVELGEDRIKASQGAALAAAKAVRQAGASLAVDDFGVGYANLGRLSKFRFDLVKTDRSLAAAAPTDKKARATLKSVIAVAHKAKMPVIAEGIEDEEAARVLEALGCDFGQGYLFGRPEPARGGTAPKADTALR